ncbi:MAG: leucine-rich repeat domain-containing protein [Promethearchaeota archaeon]
MTREPNKQKYERILERLGNGDKQSSIVITEKCSYGTISAAKQWEKNGRPNTITTTRSTSTNRTKIVLSIPNYWLECLNEDIMSGIWTDYSDAIIDIIRFFFRTRMEDYQPEPSSARRREILSSREFRRKEPNLRRDVMKELKESLTSEQVRDSENKNLTNIIELKEYKEIKEAQRQEFCKQRELIYSRFSDQETEKYIFKNYHGEPLIKEEFEILMKLEQQVGKIPKWEGIFTRGNYIPAPTDIKTYKFSYVLLGNHVIILNICGKNLNYLPESIAQLKYLQTLDLRNNNLTELPESIGNLEFLEELILHDNVLNSIPNSIGNLKNLGLLHLDNNNLKSLPETICNLKTWYPIGLSNNKIASLSEKILKMCMPQAKVTKYAKAHGIGKIWYKLDLAGNPIMEAKK